MVQRVREAVLEDGGRLVEEREKAAIVLEVASGGLSVDNGDFLIGLPAITIPVPFGAQGVTLPELALFKVESRVGKAKLLFSAVDAATGAQVAPLPVVYGRAARRFWWLFFIGPFEVERHTGAVPVAGGQKRRAPSPSAGGPGRSSDGLCGAQISTGSQRLSALAAALPQMWQTYFASLANRATSAILRFATRSHM